MSKLEIKNKTTETFSYQQGDVKIDITVDKEQLPDLRDIIAQCLKDIIEKLK